MNKTVKIILIVVGVLIAILAGLYFKFNEPLPKGVPGPEAEALTQRIFTAINKNAWDSTAWVKWTYRGDRHFHWFRHENRVVVRWADIKVELNLNDQSGPVEKNGVKLMGDEAKKYQQEAWSMFCNDSYWLNAPAKIADPGTTRSIVTTPDGKQQLLVQYSSGGVTPGDAYLWEVGPDYLPKSYKMWVKILPIGGVPATWEQWITLPTGAKVATFHVVGGREKLSITNLDAGN
jgi:hypothetical protein